MVYRLVIAPPSHSQVDLTPEQIHYVKRVLRLQDGDRLVAMDGQGQSWRGRLQGQQLYLEESLQERTELPLTVALMVALPKGNGFEEIIRPCTELGVTLFIPVLSERTLLKPSPQKCDRWQKIAMEAAEQSERQWVPRILEPQPLAAAFEQFANGKKYLCVTRQAAPTLYSCLIASPPEPLVIAIGPEGGWTETEIQQAIALDYQPVSLGKRILRTVTAPTVALALVAALWESDNPFTVKDESGQNADQ